MLGIAKRRNAVVLGLAGALAASSATYAGLTSASSSASSPIDRTVKLRTVSDTFVSSARPRVRHGNMSRLVVRDARGTRTTAFIKFSVSKAALSGGRVTGAKLLVTSARSTTAPLRVTTASSRWSERTLTRASAPTTGSTVGTVLAGRAGQRWVDVSGAVKGAGTYSFSLSTKAGAARLFSGETKRAPALLLRVAGATTAGTGGGPSPTGTGTTGGICRQQFPGEPCPGTMYYGAAVIGGDPRTLESKIGGTNLAIYRIYMTAGQKASAYGRRAQESVSNGRLPLMSTKVPGSWADVAAGKYDGWLIDRLKALAAVNGPVWFALHHEPRGDGDAAAWVRMQQHARDLIDRYAPNVVLVGILNGWDFLQRGSNPAKYRMPVGTGVEIMGFDSYNPWSPTNGRPWKTVEKAMSPGLTIQSWGYPTLVAETGVHTDPSNPGRAAQWLRDEYSYALANNFLAVSYFDSPNSRDLSWELTGERLTAFAQNLKLASVARISG